MPRENAQERHRDEALGAAENFARESAEHGNLHRAQEIGAPLGVYVQQIEGAVVVGRQHLPAGEFRGENEEVFGLDRLAPPVEDDGLVDFVVRAAREEEPGAEGEADGDHCDACGF